MEEPYYQPPRVLLKEAPAKFNPSQVPARLSVKASCNRILGLPPEAPVRAGLKGLLRQINWNVSVSLRAFTVNYMPWIFSESERLEVTPIVSTPDTPKKPVALQEEEFQQRLKCASLYFAANLDIKSNEGLLSESRYSVTGPKLLHPDVRCLGLLAYLEFFDDPRRDVILKMISAAIEAAKPGWCGTFGPDLDVVVEMKHIDANYDFTQMYLLTIIYRYYNDLTAEARNHLITELLGNGKVRRISLATHKTSGRCPNDWSRAGYFSIPIPGIVDIVGPNLKRIGETENHIFMIATARYLTNQLLYQRTGKEEFDNRRNGGGDYPSCMMQVLAMLRNVFIGGFSEYNSKPYTRYTRAAILNLYNYAYDSEVRLGARLVLDMWAAYLAVSSTDLRRLVPFRRRNESDKLRNAQFSDGTLKNNLVNESKGADPIVTRLALATGNLSAVIEPYENGRKKMKALSSEIIELLGSYRIPPPIQQLYTSNEHRRFYQRLHRTPIEPVAVTGINCDNYEIYAGSPSYLITAGGRPSGYAIDPYIPLTRYPMPDNEQQLGVAVPSSFIPTMGIDQSLAIETKDIFQFGVFSDNTEEVENYGVAPDFICGYCARMPDWFQEPIVDGVFKLVVRKSSSSDLGFILGIYKKGQFVVMEAVDLQIFPEVTKDIFATHLCSKSLNLLSGVPESYQTYNGNNIHFVIWENSEHDGVRKGAKILNIDYAAGEPKYTLSDAGNQNGSFLQGSVLNTPEPAYTVIRNPISGQMITLDWRNPLNPSRISEKGQIEVAGGKNEVWVNFTWTGAQDGDFYRPYNSITAALANVAEGGTIRVMPGSSRERFSTRGKKCKIEALLGGVTIGNK